MVPGSRKLGILREILHSFAQQPSANDRVFTGELILI